MADSAAERARRSYRHKRGDHSLCDPQRRCELIENAEMREAVATHSGLPAGGYGPRGAAYRDAMADAGLPPSHSPLVDEVARMLDRLDRLDAALHRKGEWLRFETADGGEIVITIDNVLSEARQQAATVKALMSEIRAALPAKPAGRTAASRAQEGAGLADLIDLAARR